MRYPHEGVARRKFPSGTFRPPDGRFGVGHDPHTLSPVRCPDVASTHHERPAGVASRLQLGREPVIASTSQSRDIFKK
jgi:hypothetical protein